MNKQTKTLTFAGPVNTTKDNRTFCDFVRQELFSIKSLLLLLTTHISMSGSSLSLPAPAREKTSNRHKNFLVHYIAQVLIIDLSISRNSWRENNKSQLCRYVTVWFFKSSHEKASDFDLECLLCFVLIFIEERCHCQLPLFKWYEGIVI